MSEKGGERGGGRWAKVPPSFRFLDLSDYARPAANLLVRWLLPTPISPRWVTGVYTVFGVLSAGCFFTGGFRGGGRGWMAAGAMFLQVKNLLDAVDGSLARARSTPSRVGRFLDSLADFFINLLVFVAIAPRHPIFALLALLFATLQCSYYNYYSVVYRKQTGGDTTSRVDETENFALPGDNPHLLSFLKWLYAILYGWQDRLMQYLEKATMEGVSEPGEVSPSFLTLVSPLALGFQILLVTLWAFAGHPEYALWIFLVPMNLYWGFVVAYRRYQVEVNIARGRVQSAK